MGLGKNLAIGVLNFLLIVSLSTAVMSLTFSLTLTEKTLNNLLEDGLEPYVKEQTELTFENESAQSIESRHNSALATCEYSSRYEVWSQGNESLYLECDKVRGTTAEQFMEEVKKAVSEYALAPVKENLDDTIVQLNYFKIVMWISMALSLIFIVITIVLANGFPFKTFGVTGLIAGSPLVIILLSKTFILNKIQQGIKESVPSEIADRLLHSSLAHAINDLVSRLINSTAMGFAIIFFVGLVLLLVGLLTIRKTPMQNPKSPQSNPNV